MDKTIKPGLEIIKRPDISAGELADMLCGSCPPYPRDGASVDCDATSCRDCWLAWLATGRPPKEVVRS